MITQYSRIDALLRCGLLLIEDGCPPEAAAYLCSEEDADDGTVCARCWRRYLFAIANGEQIGKGRSA